MNIINFLENKSNSVTDTSTSDKTLEDNFLTGTGIEKGSTHDKEAIRRKDAITERINTLKSSENYNADTALGKDFRARVVELEQSLQDIADMRNDDSRIYQFETGRINLTKKTGVKNGKEVITMYSQHKHKPEWSAARLLDENMPAQIHEMRHGGQIARGVIQVSEKGEPVGNWTLDIEVSAYRAQYSWLGSLPYNPAQGNVAFKHHRNNILGIDKKFVWNTYEWQGDRQVFLYRMLGFR